MNEQVRVGVATTKPTHSHPPLFRALDKRTDISLSVAYSFAPSSGWDSGFADAIDWGFDLRSGYSSVVLACSSPSVSKASKRRFWEHGKEFGSVPTVVDALRMRGKVDRWLSEFKPELVVLHGYDDPVMCLIACMARRRDIAVAMRGTSLPYGSGSVVRRTVRDARAWLAVRCIPNAFYIGTRNSEFYSRFGARKVFHVPYPADTELFDGSRVAGELRTRQRVAAGLDPDLPVVAFVGKLQPWKRPGDLLLAARAMTVRVQLLMVGAGPLGEELGKASSGLVIKMTGFVDRCRLRDLLPLVDVLVLPSSTETWGLVVHEAMCCGVVPLVSDAVGCGPDLVEGIGRIYPVGDTKSLARSLDELCADRFELARAGERAFVRAMSLSTEVAAKRFRDAAVSLVRAKV